MNTSNPINPHPKTSPWQRTIYILAFSQLISVVGFSSIFPFLPRFVEDLGSTKGLSIELLSGLVYSGQALTMMIASPIWGGLADRFGRKLMILRSTFGGMVILFIMAHVQSAEQLVIMRAIQGILTGTIAANSALAASVAPRERAGYAMGLMQVSLGAGVAVGPLIGGFLADAYGYSAAFYGTALLLLLSGLLITFGIKEDFDPAQTREKREAGMVKEWRGVLSSPGVGATFAMRFMSQMGRMIVVPIIPLFVPLLIASESNVNTYIGLVFGVSAAATTLSSIYLGRLGDRIGYRSVLIVSILAAGILYIPQSAVTEGWQLLALQGLTGIAVGGIIPSISALLANFTQPGQEGAVYGLDSSINAAGRAVAPLIGGLVAGWFNPQATFTATAFFLFISAGLAVSLIPKTMPTITGPHFTPAIKE